MSSSSARFLWYDTEGQGRNLYGMFRKAFDVQNDVDKAILNIFADSKYILFINGEFIEFGPVRFDPRYPLYDTHDISKYLKHGRNVIAVLVNYYGCRTFMAIPARAGMVAWGRVETLMAGQLYLIQVRGHGKA